MVDLEFKKKIVFNDSFDLSRKTVGNFKFIINTAE